MTLTQQIAVLRKVAKLDKSKAVITLTRYSFMDGVQVAIHTRVSGNPVKRIFDGITEDGCVVIEGYDKIMRVLDKMIAQYKELAK